MVEEYTTMPKKLMDFYDFLCSHAMLSTHTHTTMLYLSLLSKHRLTGDGYTEHSFFFVYII